MCFDCKLSRFFAFLTCFLPACLFAGTVTQWSTIDALLEGLYDGVATLGELREAGDFGLGTFHRLDGEMVVLDGTVYQIDSTGQVHRPDDSLTTPFAAVAFFEADYRLKIPAGSSLKELETLIDEAAPSANYFYGIRIHGEFELVRTRSVPPQDEPYPLLIEVVADQPVFDIQKTTGTLVGLWCPEFVKGINVTGHHFHYIDDERSSGGHVLAAETASDMVAEIAILRNFSLRLPEGRAFREVSLGADRREELEAVETER